MKLACWNVNGLRSVFKKGFHDFVAAEQPDLICLQETKAHLEQLGDTERNLSGYNLLLSSAKQRGYSGVGTYWRAAPDSALPQAAHGIGYQQFDSEGRFLITDHGPVLVYNVYIPSGTTGEVRQKFKYQFLDTFAGHIESLPASDRDRLVVCGDFNICHREIDIHHPETAAKRELSGFLPEERKWMDHFMKLGLVDTFRDQHGDVRREYTWWTFRAGARQKNLGWRIDYCLVSQALKPRVIKAEIHHKILGSDHCPITLELRD